MITVEVGLRGRESRRGLPKVERVGFVVGCSSSTGIFPFRLGRQAVVAPGLLLPRQSRQLLGEFHSVLPANTIDREAPRVHALNLLAAARSREPAGVGAHDMLVFS